jgi:hypothetical protein
MNTQRKLLPQWKSVLGCLIGLGLICFMAAPTNLFADPITLVLNQEPAQTIGPQSTSAPCIIAGTTCQNPAGFDYTNFVQSGGISSYDEASPEYEIADFPFLQFNVAIDVNTAAGGEVLDLFEISVDGTVIYIYNGDGNIGSLSSNGNGYADWTLRSVDLSGYDPGQIVQFHAVWNTASDGAESFFIVSSGTPPVIPEPATLLFLGTGLAGLALRSWWNRRKS